MKTARGIASILLLNSFTKKLYQFMFGNAWRVPFVKFSHFGPDIGTNKGETVVLCGCYRPQTLRSYRRVVGPSGRIVAIEANPKSVALLESELETDPALSAADNITLVSRGVWSEKGQATFVLNEGDFPDLDKIDSDKLRPFSYHKVKSAAEVTIETDSLDQILEDLSITHVDYVVFTINDAELEALDGVSKLLERNPKVRFKLHSHFDEPGRRVSEKLLEKGFTVFSYRIHRNTDLHKLYAYRVNR